MNKKIIIEMGLHVNQTPNFVKTAKEHDLKVYLIEEEEKIIKYPKLASLFDEKLIANNNEFERIYECLRGNSNIIGIISFEEDWLKTTAKLNEKLNLLGTSLLSVNQTIDKVQTHKLLSKVGIPTAEYKVIDTIESAKDFTRKNGYPIILKPTNKKGSRGVIKVNNDKELAPAFKNTISFCDKPKVLVEQYIKRYEFSLEGIVSEEGLSLFGITEKFLFSGTTVESMHITPLKKFPSKMMWELASLVTKTLNITFGPFHIECFDAKDNVYVNEVHTRFGGDNITTITSLASKNNIHEALICNFLHSSFNYVSVYPAEETVAVSFISGPTGIVSNIKTSGLNSKDIVKSEFKVELNQKIKYPQNSYDRLGWFIVKGKNRKDVLRLVSEIKSKIKVEVTNNE